MDDMAGWKIRLESRILQSNSFSVSQCDSPHGSSHDFSSHSWRSTLNFESSTEALREASSLHPHQPPCLGETNRPRRRRKPRKRPLRQKKELPPWGICRLAQSGVLDSHSRLNAPLPLDLVHGPLFSSVNQIRVDCCKSCKAERLYVRAGGFSDPLLLLA
ncbi:hypothetical protein NW759_006312 [Fusarium solani]|nr:hypothetical protein NW759_006312 [Fusarium solani]